MIANEFGTDSYMYSEHKNRTTDIYSKVALLSFFFFFNTNYLFCKLNSAKVILVLRSFKDQRICRTFALITKEFSRVTDFVYIYFLSASYYFVEQYHRSFRWEFVKQLTRKYIYLVKHRPTIFLYTKINVTLKLNSKQMAFLVNGKMRYQTSYVTFY